jgi:hypothetical protein
MTMREVRRKEARRKHTTEGRKKGTEHMTEGTERKEGRTNRRRRKGGGDWRT